MARVDDADEEGSYSEEIDRPSRDEIRAAAEIIVLIEENVRIDMKWLRVRVRDGYVRIQGSVETREELDEMAATVRRHPRVRDLELNVSIRDPSVED